MDHMEYINKKYPDHCYTTCSDKNTSNAGFNYCPRCTSIALFRGGEAIEQRETLLDLLERAESALRNHQISTEARVFGKERAQKMKVENLYSPLVLEIKATLTAIKESV